MKQKTHSGLKKRVRVRKSGKAVLKKSCKNHLLADKSKRQKRFAKRGFAINSTKMAAVKRMLPHYGARG